MAMNKKEQAELEAVQNELAEIKAMVITPEIKPDVAPPENSSRGLSTGWVFNSYNGHVEVACSSSVHHGIGTTDKTNAQNVLWLYSSELLAYKAMRAEISLKYARNLADLDGKIFKLECA